MGAPMTITITQPLLGQSAVCEPILRALPDWFGVEEATRQYVREIEALPTLLALREEQALGFLTLKQHSPWVAELYVMGVFPQVHRQGIGHALVAQAEAVLRAQGIEFFQVKTLAPTHPDPGYARTRAFYEAQGFRPLEIFPELWDPENPCLLMVKYLGAASRSFLKPDYGVMRP
ncbi:MAG: Mycothiol acetyltransferase [Chloroflexi bacterium ADurb.Bin360]|nr:MAG: Mycothiol acetyltransferase [Chloroflexi bacterium ADurb.Bin360]